MWPIVGLELQHHVNGFANHREVTDHTTHEPQDRSGTTSLWTNDVGRLVANTAPFSFSLENGQGKEWKSKGWCRKTSTNHIRAKHARNSRDAQRQKAVGKVCFNEPKLPQSKTKSMLMEGLGNILNPGMPPDHASWARMEELQCP